MTANHQEKCRAAQNAYRPPKSCCCYIIKTSIIYKSIDIQQNHNTSIIYKSTDIQQNYNTPLSISIQFCHKKHRPPTIPQLFHYALTLKLPGPYVGMGGSLTVTVA